MLSFLCFEAGLEFAFKSLVVWGKNLKNRNSVFSAPCMHNNFKMYFNVTEWSLTDYNEIFTSDKQLLDSCWAVSTQLSCLVMQFKAMSCRILKTMKQCCPWPKWTEGLCASLEVMVRTSFYFYWFGRGRCVIEERNIREKFPWVYFFCGNDFSFSRGSFMLSFPFKKQTREYRLCCSFQGVVRVQIPLFHIYLFT